jgi:hypothetical protein
VSTFGDAEEKRAGADIEILPERWPARGLKGQVRKRECWHPLETSRAKVGSLYMRGCLYLGSARKMAPFGIEFWGVDDNQNRADACISGGQKGG